MYATLKKGNRTPILTISNAWRTMFFLRKPGRPSYQIDASNCCTLGCATNWKFPDNPILVETVSGHVAAKFYLLRSNFGIGIPPRPPNRIISIRPRPSIDSISSPLPSPPNFRTSRRTFAFPRPSSSFRKNMESVFFFFFFSSDENLPSFVEA